MIADGLTKALPKDDYHQFINQMQLVEIQEWLLEHQNCEADIEAAVEPPEPMEVGWICQELI